MASKVKPEKQKIVWASGRGGAGNVHKAKAAKAPVDAYIPKQQKMLELETARNRRTTGGRGGTGNNFDHVLEPGVFRRVLEYEANRIVNIKAEEKAMKAEKESERRRKSTSRPADSTHHIRPLARLRSASTSTFSTSVTSASGSSAAPSSYASSSSHSTRSPTPTPSIASRLLSSLKKRSLGNKTEMQNVYSMGNSSVHTVINIENPNREPPSSVEGSMSSSTSSHLSSPIDRTRCAGASSSLGFIPPTSISCSQSRLEMPRLGQEHRYDLSGQNQYSDIYGFSSPSFTQSSSDISAGSMSSNNIRRAQRFLVEQEGRTNRVADGQARPPVVAYHLPLRAMSRNQDTVIPMNRRDGDGVLFF